MSVFAEMHDGTRLEFPDGTDPAVIQATVKKQLGANASTTPGAGHAAAQPPSVSPNTPATAAPPGLVDRVLDQSQPVLAGMSPRQAYHGVLGALRGAKDVVDTGAHFIAPAAEAERIKALDKAGTDAYEARFGGSDAAQGGRLVGQGLVTLPIGGGLGQAARLVGASPRVVQALASSGMTTGAKVAPGILPAAADLAIRSGAGAVVGGASMAAIAPEHAGTGVLIGAALPPALRVAGVTAGTLAAGWRAVMQPRAVGAAEDLAKALGVATAEQRAVLIEQLKTAPELVTNPTVAQALRTPEAGILQRVVHDSPGGAALRERLAAQAAARTAALERVAPTAPNGLGQAQEDLGRRVASTLTPERDAAVARGRALYAAVDDPANPVRLQLPLDEMQAAADKYLGPGVVGQGGATRQVLEAAKNLSTESTSPLVTNMRQPASTEATLGAAVRRLGISPDELKGASGYAGEVRHFKESKFGKGLVNKNGRSLESMAERMHEDGYLERPDVGELLEKLTDEAAGSPTLSRFGDPSRMARDAGMPDKRITPGSSTLVPVDWQTLQNLRSSAGKEAFKSKIAMNDRDAAALGEVKRAISGRVDQAAGQGLLKEGENFPTDSYARWLEANAVHAERKGRFDNGPLAGIFRTGKDGEPILQGQDIAKRAWGDVSDVKAFKKLVGDHADLLGDFKSMVTTEAAGTAPASGELGAKFVRWVDKKLPALKETFSADEVKTLQTIAADIERASQAAQAGKGIGSNTYQNAANALSLGLIDSPGMSMVAGRVPWVGRPALDFVRGKLGATKAERLAELLADAPTAANALGQIQPRGVAFERLNRLAAPVVYRGAPRWGRDR